MMDRSKQRYAYNFIAVAIRPDEHVKKELLNACAALFSDKEKTAITIEPDTDHKEKLVWAVWLHIFDDTYARDNIHELLDLCKKIVHIKGVHSLTGRLRAKNARFFLTAGDSASGESKHVLATFDTIRLFYKELVNNVPFYIKENQSQIHKIPSDAKEIEVHDYTVSITSPVFKRKIPGYITLFNVNSKTYAYGGVAGGGSEGGSVYSVSFYEPVRNIDDAIKILKSKLAERCFSVESITEITTEQYLADIIEGTNWTAFKVRLLDGNDTVTSCSIEKGNPPPYLENLIDSGFYIGRRIAVEIDAKNKTCYVRRLL